MTEIANVGIGITAKNQTDKGAREAEKRLGQIPKKSSAAMDRASRLSERSFTRSSRSIIGSLGKIEQATARVLGSRSLTSGLAGRLSAVGEAGEAAGAGLAEAAGAGGVLASSASAVAVAVGGTVAVLGAAAYAAFKLSDGWAKGAAQIGRTAEIIGVGTKALQEFAAAAERVGVDKGTATGTLGGLSQTLNDAKYGRNTQALEVLRRLGVGVALSKDGTVNVEAMLPKIADALARQNSSGRRTAARVLGIPESALPVFTQGGKALSGDMRDADKSATVISDKDIAAGKRIARNNVRIGQIGERAISEAGRVTAEKTESAGQVVLKASQIFNSAISGDFKPAADVLHRAADKISDTFDRMAGSASGMVEGNTSFSGNTKELAAKLMAFAQSKGLSRVAAAGLIANGIAESGLDPRAIGDGGKAQGLFQLHPDRQATFRRVFGKNVLAASPFEQTAFAIWELSNTEKAAGDRLRRATSARQAGGIVSEFYERPRDTQYEIGRRGAIAETIAAIPVQVTVEHKNAPSGTRTTVRAGKSDRPAVSTAMAY